MLLHTCDNLEFSACCSFQLYLKPKHYWCSLLLQSITELPRADADLTAEVAASNSVQHVLHMEHDNCSAKPGGKIIVAIVTSTAAAETQQAAPGPCSAATYVAICRIKMMRLQLLASAGSSLEWPGSCVEPELT
jgi:hypothetical protein